MSKASDPLQCRRRRGSTEGVGRGAGVGRESQVGGSLEIADSRNMIIVPEMIGSVVGVYSGKQYISVEIKPDMLGHYLAEFSFTYKPIHHGRAGGKGAAFMPLR